jgi:hypothetical protein
LLALGVGVGVGGGAGALGTLGCTFSRVIYHGGVGGRDANAARLAGEVVLTWGGIALLVLSCFLWIERGLSVSFEEGVLTGSDAAGGWRERSGGGGGRNTSFGVGSWDGRDEGNKAGEGKSREELHVGDV